MDHAFVSESHHTVIGRRWVEERGLNYLIAIQTMINNHDLDFLRPLLIVGAGADARYPISGPSYLNFVT